MSAACAPTGCGKSARRCLGSCAFTAIVPLTIPAWIQFPGTVSDPPFDSIGKHLHSKLCTKLACLPCTSDSTQIPQLSIDCLLREPPPSDKPPVRDGPPSDRTVLAGSAALARASRRERIEFLADQPKLWPRQGRANPSFLHVRHQPRQIDGDDFEHRFQ